MPKEGTTKPKNKATNKIALLKVEYLKYYRRLPLQKLAAARIGRSPDAVSVWMKADADFSTACRNARAEYLMDQADGAQTERGGRQFLLKNIDREHFGEQVTIGATEELTALIDRVSKLLPD